MRSGCSSFSKTAFASLMLVAAFGGCSPELTERHFKEPKRDFGPTRTDGDVDLAEVKMEALPTAASVRWKGDIETASWYRATDDLSTLALQLADKPLARLAYRMREGVAQSSVAWDSPVRNSAYASAAIGETRAETAKSVDAGVVMLKGQQRMIDDMIVSRNQRTHWPTSRIRLTALVEAIESFIVNFVSDVEASAVDKAVKKQLIEEFRITFAPKLQRIRERFADAYREPKVYDFVGKIRATLKDEDLNLGPNIEPRLAMAEQMPRMIDRIHDAKSALSVLVDFWQASSRETRETKFKVLAPDLYDFFNGQSEKDLECVKTGCGFFTRIKRALFILPEIEKYGVAKLKQQLSDAVEEAIKSELEEQAVGFLPSFHVEMRARIVAEFARQQNNITKISKDYGTYLRVVLDRMAIAKLGLKENDPVVTADPNRIRVDLDFGRTGRDATKPKIRVELIPKESRIGFQSGAAAIGSGLTAAVAIHDSHLGSVLTDLGLDAIRVKQAEARVMFEQLNKILMIGGFKTEAEKPFDAFSVAVVQSRVRTRITPPARFNLRTMMSSKTTYAVPDQINLGKPGRPEAIVASTLPPHISISVGGQAELLRGLSRLALSLRDWLSSPFDRVLGNIIIADFIPDLPRAAVDKKLFPKDLFYAATVGNAAAILQNLTKDHSLVGLIEPRRHIHWANEVDPADDPTKMAIMATAFDMVDGERSLDSKTIEVARFLSAISDFMRATDGIEQTKSSILLRPSETGVRPVDQIRDARADLKLVIMALANFLSSEALGKDGLARPVFHRSQDLMALGMSGTPVLLDQVTVIRALLDASEAIKAEIFQTSALDLMSATNKAFFRPQQGFYSEKLDSNEPPNLETIAAVLIAGERLAPHMSSLKASQWRQISRPWINALRDAAETLP